MIKYIRKLLPKEFVVGLSSGVDSLAVAHFLKFQAYKKFTVFHFNHLSENHNDFQAENCAVKFCNDFNIPLVLLRADRPLENEAESREGRLNAFNAHFHNTNLIMAHHLLDSVESHYMNFFKGKEAHLPIPLKSQFGSNTIWHPFLTTDKSDFESYVKENKLESYLAIDPTNFESDFTMRNWVRNTVIPEVETKQIINMKTIVRKRIIKAVSNMPL